MCFAKETLAFRSHFAHTLGPVVTFTMYPRCLPPLSPIFLIPACIKQPLGTASLLACSRKYFPDGEGTTEVTRFLIEPQILHRSHASSIIL